MVPKISRGSGFRGALNYLLDEGRTATGAKQPEFVAGNLAGRDARALAAELAAVRALRPDVARPVWHCSLSLPDGERLTAAQWQAVIGDYLKEMGFSDQTPYIAVRHQDTDHDHVHLVASRIDLDGQVWKGQWEARRAIQACQVLEQRHGLTLTPGREAADREPGSRAARKAPTPGERRRAERTGTAAPRERLRGLIDEALRDRPGLAAFTERLTAQGVDVRANVARTGRMNGFSFALDGVAFKGSDLGKAYTWNGLQARGLGGHAPEPGDPRGEAMRTRDIDDEQKKTQTPEAERAETARDGPTPDGARPGDPARPPQAVNDNRLPPPPTIGERTGAYRQKGRYDALRQATAQAQGKTAAPPLEDKPYDRDERLYEYQGQREAQLRAARERVNAEQRDSLPDQHRLERRDLLERQQREMENHRNHLERERQAAERADPRATGFQRLGLWVQGKAKAHDDAHAKRTAQRQQEQAKALDHRQCQQQAAQKALEEKQRTAAQALQKQQTEKAQAQERAFITDRARQSIRLTPEQEKAVKDNPQSREAYEKGLTLRAADQGRSGQRQQGRTNGNGQSQGQGRSRGRGMGREP